MNAPRPIDLVYSEINAIGGRWDLTKPEDAACKEIVDRVLDILEAHGARDVPLISSPSFAEHQAGFQSFGGN